MVQVVTASGESLVNTTTTNNQQTPTVTALADGGWVVTWASVNQDAPGQNDFGVYQQRYTAAGVKDGAEALVNTTTASNQFNPTVTRLADGGWVVTWVSVNQDAPGQNNYGVYQQRYTAAGAKDGGETLVNTTTTSNQESPPSPGSSTAAGLLLGSHSTRMARAKASTSSATPLRGRRTAVRPSSTPPRPAISGPPPCPR